MEVLNVNQERANLSRLTYSAKVDLLCVRDLSVDFRLDSGRAASILKQINFTIASGEIVGLLGESGSGKTTTALALMRMLPSAARIVSGTLDFVGRNLLTLDTRRLREIRGSDISIVYQDSDVLNPVMRVGDQVMEVLRAHKRSSASQMRDEVHSVLSAMGFEDCERIFHAYPHQLSGGQRRRIAIAQAVVCKPRLVIADEPTAWLDSKTAGEILSLFARLRDQHGTAFLLISHDPETLTLADRALVMYAGEIVESGPINNLFAEAKHPYLQALLRCRTFAGESRGDESRISGGQRYRLPCIPGQAPDPSKKLSGCSFASRCSERMESCDTDQPPLIAISDARSVRCFLYGDGE
jgi:oligopeptide/dipeptide ABC transporter ATP-binding protein